MVHEKMCATFILYLTRFIIHCYFHLLYSIVLDDA